MGYWVELVNKDTQREIDHTSTNITSNLNTMFEHLPCGNPGKWTKHPLNKVLDEIQKSLDALIQSPDDFKKYEAKNGWGTVTGMTKFLSDVLTLWQPYHDVGQIVDGEHISPDENGITDLLLAGVESVISDDFQDSKVIAITLPILDTLNDFWVELYFNPEKHLLTDAGYTFRNIVSDKVDKKKAASMMKRVAEHYECSFDDNHWLSCKTDKIINTHGDTRHQNANFPMVLCIVVLYTIVRYRIVDKAY